MATRIVEGKLPYTGGTGIGIDTNKVISLLLREENNLIHVNEDNEVYTDLQLAVNITPSSDFPVGVTVGKVLQTDGWTQNGLILNRKTTSGDYARWLYGADGELYFDGGQGTWKQVYYSDEVLALFTQLRGELATVAFTGDYNDLTNRPTIPSAQVNSDWNANSGVAQILNKPTIPTDTNQLTNGAGYITSAYHDSSKQDTLSAGTGISITSNTVANTGVTSFNGSTGAVTYTAPVTSVNGSTGAVTVTEFTPSGTATTGYVVTKTADGYGWQAPSGGDVMVSSQANNILTSGMKIWAGTEANYQSLGSYDQNTVYLTI